MDPSKIASAAGNATGGSNGVTSATANVGMPNIGGSKPQTPSTPETPSSQNKQTPSNGQNNSEKPSNESKEHDFEPPNDELGEFIDDENEELSEEDIEEGPQPGDKVGTGKQIGENGEVEDSSTKKTLKAVGRGAAAYATGGESIGKDQQIANMKPVDDAIGVVSDKLDQVPGVEQISKELDEAGLADGVNDVLDTVGNAKNGDIAGTIESGKKALKDVDKTKKYVLKKVLIAVLPIFLVLFLIVVVFVAILAPIIGGFLDVVESDDGMIGEVSETIVDEFVFDNNDLEVTAGIIGEIEGFENLSEARQKIVAAAASAVAAGVEYEYGSHPHGPGLSGIPSAGLDCAGFVQWALWTGLGGNPGYLTTAGISSKIGTDFIQISKSELQPGDIGLKRTGGSEGKNYNHTGIYAGNNQWIHAANEKTGVVRGTYDDFTIFLRYKGVS